MSPPVAQQIITSMKIIMGEDGTDEGLPFEKFICILKLVCLQAFSVSIFTNDELEDLVVRSINLVDSKICEDGSKEDEN